MTNRWMLLFIPVLFMGCGDRERDQPQGGPPPRPVEVTTVQRRQMTETLTLVGSLAANESVVVRPEISGRVAEILFSEGDEVRRGDVLLRIDDREPRAELRDAEARLKLAAGELKRHQALFAEGFVSEAELDDVRAEQQRAAADVDLYRARLEKSQVRAPFSGVAGARAISPGELVTPETAITRVDDLSRLKIDFMVPERYLPDIGTGTPVRLLSRDDVNSNTRGEVYFISPSVDRQNRASQVKAVVKNPPPTLRPGMFANIEVILNEIDALTVPESAVLSRPDGDLLVLVQEQEGQTVAAFFPVRLGLRSRGIVQVEALDGELRAGQEIVAVGVGSLPLFPGAPIDPRPVKTREGGP